MSFKIVLLFAAIAATTAQHHTRTPHGQLGSKHRYQHGHHGHHVQHYGPVDYKFSYSVQDEKHGDFKHQEETRHGDLVQGEYSLIEPDGYRRTVKYSSDKHTGFVADVHREAVKGYKVPMHGGGSHGNESTVVSGNFSRGHKSS